MANKKEKEYSAIKFLTSAGLMFSLPFAGKAFLIAQFQKTVGFIEKKIK